MPNKKSAIKRVRQSTKARMRNMGFRSRFRTYLKKVLFAIQGGNSEEAREVFKQTESVIDKTVSKGLIHVNKAARHKRRLSAKIRAMQST